MDGCMKRWMKHEGMIDGCFDIYTCTESEWMNEWVREKVNQKRLLYIIQKKT